MEGNRIFNIKPLKIIFSIRMKNCEMLLEEEKDNKEFKKEELICANCTDIPIETCKQVNNIYNH